MTLNGQNCPKLSLSNQNGINWSQLVPSDFKWSQTIQNGPKWSQMASNGLKRSQILTNGTKWTHMVPYGPYDMVPNEPKRSQKAPNVLNCFKWTQISSIFCEANTCLSLPQVSPRGRGWELSGVRIDVHTSYRKDNFRIFSCKVILKSRKLFCSLSTIILWF